MRQLRRIESYKTDDLITDYVACGRDADGWRPSYDVAPTNRVPIFREWIGKNSGELNRPFTSWIIQ